MKGPTRDSRVMTSPAILAAFFAFDLSGLASRELAAAAPANAAIERPGALERRWYSPRELLPRLAERDGFHWAMPETLAGLALVGGEATSTHATLDGACKQWGLGLDLPESGVLVIHRPDNEKLQHFIKPLKAGGDAACEAAWELGWLADARATPALAAALARIDRDPSLALAAAQAIETLCANVPLGRAERVDAELAGRVSLAAACPPAGDLNPLLDSPYPPVRAAALRLMLGAGGGMADTARAKSQHDRSILVQRVRQQLLFETPRPAPIPSSADKRTAFGFEGPAQIPPAPRDPAELKNACDRMVAEIPSLAAKSEWEQMRWRARILAGWSRAGNDTATASLIQMGTTDIQGPWFPPYVHRQLTGTGSPLATARVREIFAGKGNGRDTIVRGLEETMCGDALLGMTRPFLGEQTVCYVTTRKAGRAALDDLLALAVRSGAKERMGDDDPLYFTLDCLGVVGGRKAVTALGAKLNQDEPQCSTLAFRSAKALAAAGTSDAVQLLLAAAQSPDRLRRHAAVLFLGRIGGPDATRTLLKIIQHDDDRLVRAAAADALEQIGTKEAIAAAEQFHHADQGPPSLAYAPRNPRFSLEFPVNEWVDLKIRIRAYAEYGEMGWNYDAANRLFFRYGGCSGYTNELTLFDLGSERFTQRRPNEKMAGWDDRRAPRGCSAGRAWDPFRKVAWLGAAIGGTDADVAVAEYFNRGGRPAGAASFRFCSYDLATDRFRPAEYLETTYGEAANRFAYDWKDGLLFPVKFSRFPEEKPFWAFDTRDADPWSTLADHAGTAWKNLKSSGPYPREGGYACAAVDQESGILVLYVPPSALTKGKPQTWTYDPRANEWKEMQPADSPRAVAGGGFAYDPFHKLLILQSGHTSTQYGGPADSVTWTYDVRANRWTDLAPKNGPGNAWVGAMDFDPEHNVFVLFNHHTSTVWAYRLATVTPGTKVGDLH